MDTFHYVIRPTSRNATRRFTTRPVEQLDMEEAEFLARMVVHGSASPEEAATNLRAFFATLREATRQTRRVGAVLGLFRAQPTSGGAFESAQSTVTPENAGLSFAFQPTREFLNDLRQDVVMHDAGGEVLGASWHP